MQSQNILWRPNPGPQARFLGSTAYEVLYGGQAGGGKSAALVAMPLRWADHPSFRALVLRRETTQLGNLLDKAQAIYPGAFPGARFHGTDSEWTFPKGGRARFSHCKEERDKYDYQGDEFQLIAFDELTHFTLTQYLEIATRIRSADPGLPRYLRATSNPGGVGHDWVLQRWGAWLNPDFEAEGLQPRLAPDGRRLPPALPGQILWVLKRGNREVYVPRGTPGAKSRQFIPAALKDNPVLLAEDPDYALRLEDLDPVRRAQLAGGDWMVRPGAGLYFQRSWVEWLDAPPEGLNWIRAWDLAATPATEHTDPDWTVGVKMAAWGERVVIAHVARMRGGPGEVRAFVKATAESDGKACKVSIPHDPGQAGSDQTASYQALLSGWSVHLARPSKDKLTRFGPFSAQASPPACNVTLVRGTWTDAYIDELEAFPEGAKDDQVDATSDAFNNLPGPPTRLPRPKIALPKRRM